MSNRRLYVGNLSYSTTSDGLRAYFESAGAVVSAEVINHKSGRSKGFGFVEMESDEGAQAAIASLNGTTLDDRPIRIDLAKPKTENEAGADRAPRNDRPFRSDRAPTGGPDRGGRGGYDRGDRPARRSTW